MTATCRKPLINLAFQCRQKDCDYDVCLSCLGLFVCTACGATEFQAGRQFNLRGLRSHQTHCTVFREQSKRLDTILILKGSRVSMWRMSHVYYLLREDKTGNEDTAHKEVIVKLKKLGWV